MFFLTTRTLLPLFGIASCAYSATAFRSSSHQPQLQPKILILGGGVSGVIAARTLHEHGFTNFVIIEGRDELGGRLRSFNLSGTTLEFGANWVQGTQSGATGPANPIYSLALKHKVKTHLTNFTSVTTYDDTGAVDYLDVFSASINAYARMLATSGDRLHKGLVDITGRTAYMLAGSRPKDAHSKAAEYYQFDWENAQTPLESSAFASSWCNNFTFYPEQGGFSPDNLFSLDPRGFKALIHEEAKEFLLPNQTMFNSTVKEIFRSKVGVEVALQDGSVVSADYALCTFSLGVLQNDDVKFVPELPDYKKEAIASMTMGTYTKIFLRFPHKFWFDTEFALYADHERGRYPIWQSLDLDGYLPGSGILFVTITGDYSERVEALPDHQVKAEVLSVLQAMYPNVTIPDPIDFRFPRWLADPLYRGSFSGWPPSFFKQHHDNLRANVGRLYFAGEHTSLKYFGFLHAAYFEGRDMAKHMIDCIINHDHCADLTHFNNVTNALPYGSLDHVDN